MKKRAPLPGQRPFRSSQTVRPAHVLKLGNHVGQVKDLEMADTDKVVPLHADQIERRIKEAVRLANLAPGEHLLWYRDRARHLGIPPEELLAAINAILRDRKEATEKEERHTRETDRKAARTEAEARDKAKDKRRLFQRLQGQSAAKQEAGIKLWCEVYTEDPEVIARELAEYLAPTIAPVTPPTEVWAEPVDGAALIAQIERRITRHLLMVSAAGTMGAAFWTLQCWLHQEIALFSPILAPWSAEAEQGKTTLLDVISYMVPRPHREVRPTISIYSTIDSEEPTLFIDEGEKLFKDRNLEEIINNSWSRGYRVHRMVRGARMPFKIFCPKAVGLLGRNDVPPATATRCLFIEMMAPTEAETKFLEKFMKRDDEELREIRLKSARWASDNAAVLRDAKPVMPIGFVNRLADNWSLMFAIADLIGGEWPERLRRAAMQLAPTIDDQNLTDGKRLLAEFRVLFGKLKRPWVTSKEINRHLTEDPLGPWSYYHGHPITEREIAHLLRKMHQIQHRKVTKTLWGFRAEDFVEKFKRILRDPLPTSGDLEIGKLTPPPDLQISPSTPAKSDVVINKIALKSGHRLGRREDGKYGLFGPGRKLIAGWFDSRTAAIQHSKEHPIEKEHGKK
jgi:Protein of unknown function (DUF3631)